LQLERPESRLTWDRDTFVGAEGSVRSRPDGVQVDGQPRNGFHGPCFPLVAHKPCFEGVHDRLVFLHQHSYAAPGSARVIIGRGVVDGRRTVLRTHVGVDARHHSTNRVGTVHGNHTFLFFESTLWDTRRRRSSSSRAIRRRRSSSSRAIRAFVHIFSVSWRWKPRLWMERGSVSEPRGDRNFVGWKRLVIHNVYKLYIITIKNYKNIMSVCDKSISS